MEPKAGALMVVDEAKRLVYWGVGGLRLWLMSNWAAMVASIDRSKASRFIVAVAEMRDENNAFLCIGRGRELS